MSHELLTINQTNMGERSFYERVDDLPVPTPEELSIRKRMREEDLEKEEDAVRDARHRKAGEKYEESLKSTSSPEEEASEEASVRENKKLSETHKPSGLKSRRTSRGWGRGHRHGEKPEKPGREAKRKEMRREAA